VLELAHDPLRSALRDADPLGDVAETEIRLGGDGEQDMRVVGQERPGRAVVTPARRHGPNASRRHTPFD
jgi:hypothetical protein